jgi:hypothetical protein
VTDKPWEAQPIRPEVVDLLARLDDEALKREGVWRDAETLEPFTRVERELAGSALPHELAAVITRMHADLDQRKAHLADRQRLHELFLRYAPSPDTTMGQARDAMTPTDGAEFDALLERLGKHRAPDAPPPPEGGCQLCVGTEDVVVHWATDRVEERSADHHVNPDDVEDELVPRIRKVRPELDDVTARQLVRGWVRAWTDRHVW